MLNKECQAETEVNSSTNAELLPSAQMPQNPMLCDAFLSGLSNYDNNSDVRKAFDNLWNQQN